MDNTKKIQDTLIAIWPMVINENKVEIYESELITANSNKNAVIEKILEKKINTSKNLEFIDFKDLDFSHLSNLKKWKQRNFLILFNLKDFFVPKKHPRGDFISSFIKKKIPVLFVVQKKYIKKYNGPISLKIFFKLISKKLKDFNLFKELNEKGFNFLFIKSKSERLKFLAKYPKKETLVLDNL